MLIKYKWVGFLTAITFKQGPKASVRDEEFDIEYNTDTYILTITDKGTTPHYKHCEGDMIHTYLHNMREAQPIKLPSKK